MFVEYTHYFTGVTTNINTKLVTKVSSTALVIHWAEHIYSQVEVIELHFLDWLHLGLEM